MATVFHIVRVTQNIWEPGDRTRLVVVNVLKPDNTRIENAKLLLSDGRGLPPGFTYKQSYKFVAVAKTTPSLVRKEDGSFFLNTTLLMLDRQPEHVIYHNFLAGYVRCNILPSVLAELPTLADFKVYCCQVPERKIQGVGKITCQNLKRAYAKEIEREIEREIE